MLDSKKHKGDEMSKGVLLMSSGLDAVTLLDSYRTSIEVCLYVKTSSRATNYELKLAEDICSRYKKGLIVIDLNETFQTYKSQSSKCKISRIEKPMRNGVLITTAAGLADSMGLDSVFIGTHKGDEVFCPDGSAKFVKSIGKSIYRGTNKRVRLRTPFLTWSKKDIAYQYKHRKIPYELSYSCFVGHYIHCGICNGCIERKIALGEDDKTIYEDSRSFSRAPLSLAPGKVAKICREIVEQRQSNYGNIRSDEIAETTNLLVKSIDVSKGEEGRSMFFKSMLASKSQRILRNGTNEDHYIDFINYLRLAKESGYIVSLGSGVFAFSDVVESYFNDSLNLESLIESIWSRGFFADSFLHSRRILR